METVRINKCSKGLKAIFLTLCVFLSLSAYAGWHPSKTVNVGETFTVYATHHSYTQSVAWTWDYGCLEPVDYITATTTSVTFKALKPTTVSGCGIQATTYYHKRGSSSTGLLKDMDHWTIFVEDNSTVSLNPSNVTLDIGETTTLYASVSSYDYSGNITWSTSNSDVAYLEGWGDTQRTLHAYGSGSATITVELDNGNTAQCYVTVRNVKPESATISSPIEIDAEESRYLSVDVYPSNAHVSSEYWEVMPGYEDFVSITSSGRLTGLNPGTGKIYCTLNGTVQSNVATVNVSEPVLRSTSSTPEEGSTGISAFMQPSVDFSTDISLAGDLLQISLWNVEMSSKVAGVAEVSGKTVRFLPDHPLLPQTNYRLTIPAHMVKNRWGTSNSQAVQLNFKTGDWEKLSLSVTPEHRFLLKGDSLRLSCNQAGALIYYTLDGTDPTRESSLYQQPIRVNADIRLRAVAMKSGYEDSDILSKDYYLSDVDIVQKFPDSVDMYTYEDVNPHLTFSSSIQASERIGEITLKKNNTEVVAGSTLVYGRSVYFIPDTPLELGARYEMSLPENAVVNWRGEANHPFSWTFSTGRFVTAVESNGPELALARNTDGDMISWGKRYESGNSADGSYEYTPLSRPDTFLRDDFIAFSSGYMHHAAIKSEGSLWMWGRQYCGEFGNGSTQGSARPTFIMDSVQFVSAGGQTTAVIKKDNSLWLCGRNDFGQIGDSTVITRQTPVRIMENTQYAAAGWGRTFAIQKDGSLYAWGLNSQHQLGLEKDTVVLQPMKIMDHVALVETSATEGDLSAAIQDDGTLWIWGGSYVRPQQVDQQVCSVAVGRDHIEYVKEDGELWRIGQTDVLSSGTAVQQPVPVHVMDEVQGISVGDQTTLIHRKDGSVWSYGSNKNGKLGIGKDEAQCPASQDPVQIIKGRSLAQLQGIQLDRHELRVVKDSLGIITALPRPLNGIYSQMEWTSADDQIASVSDRGVVTANSLGDTQIEVMISEADGTAYTATCHVIVTDLTGIDDVVPVEVLKVWASHRTLYIKGLQTGQQIDIYALNGKNVTHLIADGPTETLPLPVQGVYIVRVDHQSFKVLNK